MQFAGRAPRRHAPLPRTSALAISAGNKKNEILKKLALYSILWVFPLFSPFGVVVKNGKARVSCCQREQKNNQICG
jgi:hypothetical protein